MGPYQLTAQRVDPVTRSEAAGCAFDAVLTEFAYRSMRKVGLPGRGSSASRKPMGGVGELAAA